MNKLLVAYYTIVRREICRIFRIWPQTLLPPVITTSLYLLIFGELIGHRLGNVAGEHSYITFIIPGLVAMSLMIQSYENSVSSFFIAKFQRSIEELLVSPTPNYIIIFGYVTGASLRGLLISLLVYITSTFFIYIPISDLKLLILVSILATVIFAQLGLINAFIARNFDDVSWVPSFVLTPLTYLGGVFYSIDMLPDFWKKLSLYNPLFHIITLFRHAFIDSPTLYPCHISLLVMFALVALLFGITLVMLKLGTGLKQ